MSRTKSFCAVIISAMFFGMMPLFAKTVCAAGGNMIGISFYRFFIALFPLFAYLKFKGIPLAISGKELRKIIRITVFGYGGTALLLYISYDFVPSGMATTVHFVYPIFVILGSILFLREKPRPAKLLCVALCMGGIFLFSSSPGDTGMGELLGLLIAFASGITYAYYVIYLNYSGLQELPALKLIFYMNIVAAILLFAGSCATGNFFLELEPLTAWPVMILLATGASFIGVCLFQKGMEVIGAQNAVILGTFEPITSLVIGVAVYKEPFGITTAIGCGLILTSVVIVSLLKE